MRPKQKGEEGLITVEAVLSLVPFILAILGIISFTNIFMVHNKVQYALYQMGSELSGYTYFYQALGLRAADLKLKDDIDAQTEDLDKGIEELSSFLSQIGELENSAKQLQDSDLSNLESNFDNLIQQGQSAYEQGQSLAQTARELVSDPKALLRGFIYLGIEKAEGAAKSFLLQLISSGLMSVYLDESFAGYNPMTADQYLRFYGVKDGIDGLDFSRSNLFNDDQYRVIDIMVEYDLEVYFFKLFMKDPTIHVVQRCIVPAWLDGDGRTFSK